MEQGCLGAAGLQVSRLGIGLAEIGSTRGYRISRARLMLEENGPLPGVLDDPVLLSLWLTLAPTEVDTAIVGTHNPDHMLANIMMVETKLPIPAEAIEELHRRFDALDDGWRQLT